MFRLLRDGESFDYIIVGGGTAGSIVASRLAANGSTVLVIEAGNDAPLQSLNSLAVPLQIKSEVDYKYIAQPNSEKDITKHRSNKAFNYISGKMLRGSSNMFTQYHIRADPPFYDQRAQDLGDFSYSYESLLPYFIKSKSLKDEEILQQYRAHHGTEGPIGLQRRPYDILDKFLDAFAELGNKILLDKNADNNVGYFHPLYEIADGSTQAAGHRYFGMVKHSKNLFVLKNTIATEIVFNSKNVATGVKVENDELLSTVTSLLPLSKSQYYKAKKEVIMAAGVMNTPKLLMLSGIGPKKYLQYHKIHVRADLPVGQTLQDLYGATLGYKMKKNGALIPLVSPLYPYPHFAGYTALDKSQCHPDYLTENFYLPSLLPLAAIYCSVIFGFNDDVCQAYQDAESAGYDLYLTVVVTMDPKSHGYVKLKSKNPRDDPKITAPYLNNLKDLDNLVDYVMDHHRILNTTYFRNEDAQFVKPISDCDEYEVGTRDYWYCYVPNMLMSIFKYTSSCAMGSVVDTSFKVKGFENVRVVDASALPSIPRAHVIRSFQVYEAAS